MVLVVTGATLVAPPAVGAAAGTAVAATVAGAGAIQGASVGATVLAMGEGALYAVGLTAGPVGCLVVGCNTNEDRDGVCGYTWDCWKPVVRDTSEQPSHGMTLRCLAAHPNVRSVLVDQGELLVGNVFDECFRLTPVSVEGSLALHASILSS
ncbi:hypothetical protein CcaCcLH18_13224 [Colletotrichum camelliae]|nr:hypothetical protein CcaCcLH18_13224 [Colletotrichum camelliae]